MLNYMLHICYWVNVMLHICILGKLRHTLQKTKAQSPHEQLYIKEKGNKYHNSIQISEVLQVFRNITSCADLRLDFISVHQAPQRVVFEPIRVTLPGVTERTTTGFSLPATKPKPSTGSRLISTFRGAGGASFSPSRRTSSSEQLWEM